MKLKDNIIYNQADNFLYVKSEGDKIVIICNRESQQEDVIKRNEYQEDKSWIHQQQDSRHNQW